MLDTMMLKRVNKLLEDLDPKIQITADQAWQQFQETMLHEIVNLPPTPIITRCFAASAYSIEAMSVPQEFSSLSAPVEPEVTNQATVRKKVAMREPGSFTARAKQPYVSSQRQPVLSYLSGPNFDRNQALSVLCQIGIYNTRNGCSPSQNELVKNLHFSKSTISGLLDRLFAEKLISGNIIARTVFLQDLAYHEFPELHALIEENSSTIALAEKKHPKNIQ